ncbi:aldo/keto reductase [Altererythrobacter lauratis]|uniref:Aldo/keto reductase n=1 Tax=Alteraurantiacibacter lauratis TaxID=2054627 RepID=A0ABV7ECX2_9SPHN
MRALDRREFLAGLAAAPLVTAASGTLLGNAALAQAGYNMRPLPPAGDVPLVGMGTARNYQDPQTEEDHAPLRATIARFAELGGRVIDTAPSYGRAEEVLGRLIAETGTRSQLYIATKIGASSAEEGAAQLEQSFAHLQTDFLDLVAVHNLRDLDNQLALIRRAKDAGRVGAVGITTSFKPQYEEFEAVMRREPLDCIQIDYALDNRSAAERILPLAQDLNLPVMINLPFGRERLFSVTRGLELPGWAADIGATSWAQVFLKYIISHPCRPIAIPGTDRVAYAEDNLGAAAGVLPDAALRARMEAFIDAL